MDDHTSIVKALAKLVSHRVGLDLLPLYNLEKTASIQNTTTLKTITLGGRSIINTILSEENRQFFQNLPETTIPNYQIEQTQSIMSNFQENKATNSSKIHQQYLETSKGLKSSDSAKIHNKATHVTPDSNYFYHPISLSDFNKSQYHQLIANNARVNKAHVAFLKARQESSKQLSEIILLQLSAVHNLLNQ